MKTSNLINSVVATFVVAAIGGPAIAFGSDNIEGKSVKVSYADLDIDRKAGAKKLYRRLQLASKEVCGVESLQNAGTAAAVSTQKRCYRKALGEAVARVDSEELSKLHEG